MRRVVLGLVFICSTVFAEIGYVLNANSENVSVVDTELLKVTETISIEGNGLPLFIGVSSDHSKLIAGGNLDPLNIVDLNSKGVVKTISGSMSGNPVFTQDGTFAYVPMGGSVLEVNCTTYETQTYPASGQVNGIVLSQNKGYATNGNGGLSTFPTKGEGDSKNLINSNTLQVCVKSQTVYTVGNNKVHATLPDGSTLPPIPVGNAPSQLILSPDGTKLFVSNRGDGTVSIINTEDHQKLNDIVVGVQPSKMVITPDGALLLVLNTKGNTLSIIDVEDERNVIDYPVGQMPECITLSPDGKTMIITNLQDDTVTLMRYNGSTIQYLETIPVGVNPYGCSF